MITGGVKFDTGGTEGVMYEFDSNRAPVYHHISVKDGGGNNPTTLPPGSTTYVVNRGLEQFVLNGTVDTDDANDYVAAPNSAGAIPEPASVLVWAFMASSGLGFIASRRRR